MNGPCGETYEDCNPCLFPVCLRIPFLIIKGPANSTPLTENGLVGIKLCFGNGAIRGDTNLGLARTQVTQRFKTERAMLLPLIGQYLCLISASNA